MSQSHPKRVSGMSYVPAESYSLFYFPSDNSWSLIGLSHSSWIDLSKCDRAFLSIGDTTSLRHEGRPCTAVLIAKGDSKEDLEEKRLLLIKKMDNGTFTPSRSFLEDLNSEGKACSSKTPVTEIVSSNVNAKVANSTPLGDEVNLVNGKVNSGEDGDGSVSESSDDSQHENLETPVDSTEQSSSSGCIALHKETLSVLKKLNTSLERRRREDRRMRLLLSKHLNGMATETSSPVQLDRVYATNELVCPDSGENLLDVVGSSANKYACNLARKLFCEAELIDGMLEPQRDSPRVQLNRSKVDLIKACVRHRFPGNDWCAVRDAVNQLGRDIKRKRKAIPLGSLDQNKRSQTE